MARILIIDDDAGIRQSLRALLERAGHDVADARDGGAGLRIHAAQRADLIITDLFMPDYDGIETIRELRRTDPTVKIIAMSGGGFDGTVDLNADAKSLGAQHSLRKPLDGRELLEAVREVLGQG
ncbi:MAG TPA: response regulator [Gemmatimonadales bacterium]|nr:response regulator [Gemmatimonadales bacterium]HYT81840.1 response regulator [Gemmatimonadales bacterium]